VDYFEEKGVSPEKMFEVQGKIGEVLAIYTWFG
jgi:hypothetical protein